MCNPSWSLVRLRADGRRRVKREFIARKAARFAIRTTQILKNLIGIGGLEKDLQWIPQFASREDKSPSSHSRAIKLPKDYKTTDWKSWAKHPLIRGNVQHIFAILTAKPEYAIDMPTAK